MNIELIRSGRNKNIRITVRNDNRVRITYPLWVSKRKVMNFVESKMDWIVAVQERNRNKADSLKVIEVDDIEALRPKAKQILSMRCQELAKQYGFDYNRLTIKNNKTNWGSCSNKGNINLNMRLILLPEHIMDYIILHELCHLRYHNHGSDFHELLNRLCDGKSRELDRELKQYKIR